jgi:hypothetical protein
MVDRLAHLRSTHGRTVDSAVSYHLHRDMAESGNHPLSPAGEIRVQCLGFESGAPRQADSRICSYGSRESSAAQ